MSNTSTLIPSATGSPSTSIPLGHHSREHLFTLYQYHNSAAAVFDVCYFAGHGYVSDQGWYWTPEWQAMEAEVVADLREGRFRVFETVDDFIDFLESEDG